ncbi:unnamed protein product [Cuscuta campestris]|uniref:Uncharacterized protein n=1 Tax=Cuscuta campestris TaxID=132261 RepID=A0A484L300_9ASTE|nr:unnamed protein product [Cuscuta campestris]
MRATRVSEIGTKDAPLALDPRANSSRRGRRIYRSASRWTAYLGLTNSIVADDLECLAGRAYLSLLFLLYRLERGTSVPWCCPAFSPLQAGTKTSMPVMTWSGGRLLWGFADVGCHDRGRLAGKKEQQHRSVGVL